jgi:serine/threonine protein kinase
MNELYICPNCCNDSCENGICPSCGYKSGDIVNNPHTLPIGTVLRDRYFIGKVLGEGGFGITYMGYDKTLKLKVAIKEYYPSGYANREHTGAADTVTPYSGEKGKIFERCYARFKAEAVRLSKFASENGVVTARDLFEENSTAYIVMEFIEGDSLKTILSQCKTISEESTLEMLDPIIKTLAKMHKAHIIHRDIAPDNIMVDREGRAHLIDFGSAVEDLSNNATTMAFMKRGFAADEMQDADHTRQGTWTDVYSICATIYAAIEGKNPTDVYDRRRGKELVDFTMPISAAAKKAIKRGLALEPEDRIQTMEQLLDELYKKEKPAKKDKPEKKDKPAPDPEPAIELDYIDEGKTISGKGKKKPKRIIKIIAAAFIILISVRVAMSLFTWIYFEVTTMKEAAATATTVETTTAIPENEDITEFIPDENFRAAIRSKLKLGLEAPIYRKDVESVKNLMINAWNISDLTGIELFTALEVLNCNYNQLTSLPGLPDSLTKLYCSNNRLESLPELPDGLTLISCFTNELTSVPELPNNLVWLDCSDNDLESLPELPNTITYLRCNITYININEVVFKDGQTALEKKEAGVLDVSTRNFKRK